MTLDHEDWTRPETFDEAVDDIEEALPLVVGDNVYEMDTEQLDDVFTRATAGLSEPEAESIGSALQKVGRWAGSQSELREIAGAVLPTAGAAIGTVYGGPVGTAVGQTIGEQAGRAIAGSKPVVKTAPAPAPPPAPAPAPAPTSASAPAPVPGPAPQPVPAAGATTDAAGSLAAAKLLYLVQNPAFLSSLLALTLGPNGQRTVPAGPGAQPVPLGTFLTAASTLTNEAARDADALIGELEGDWDSYLKDDTGCAACDPAVPEQRVERLLSLLQQDDRRAPSFEAYDDPIEDESADAWWDDEEGWWEDEW